MEKAVISFSSVLRSLFTGRIAEADLEGVTLYFGCAREHVIVDDESKVPMEVTWLNQELRTHRYDEHLVDLTECEPAAGATWLKLERAIRKADAEDRLRCRVGNYPDLRDWLVSRGQRVFYDGLWHEPEEVTAC